MFGNGMELWPFECECRKYVNEIFILLTKNGLTNHKIERLWKIIINDELVWIFALDMCFNKIVRCSHQSKYEHEMYVHCNNL